MSDYRKDRDGRPDNAPADGTQINELSVGACPASSGNRSSISATDRTTTGWPGSSTR